MGQNYIGAFFVMFARVRIRRIYIPSAVSKDWHLLATFVKFWWQSWNYKELIIIFVGFIDVWTPANQSQTSQFFILIYAGFVDKTNTFRSYIK